VISVYTKDVQVETKMSFRLTVFQKMACFVDGKEELILWFWMVRMAILGSKLLMRSISFLTFRISL